MTVDQIAASQSAAGAGASFPAATTAAAAGATDPTAFAAALQRELAAGAAAVGGADDAVATPMARTTAAAATPVTFGQMLALSTASATGDATASPALLPAGASALAQAAAAQAAAAPIVAPVSAPAATPGGLVLPVEGRFSSPFGMRTHPISGARKMHTGVDIAAPTGTPIKAAAGGTVSFAGVRGGYGNLVIVDHADGSQTYYAHQDELRVGAGDRVAAGQVVGTVGSTGNSTGPHLHFELRRGGEPVDAAPLLGLSR